MHFINETYINSLIDDEELLNEHLQKDLIKKGLESKGLTLRESAALLNINKPDILEELFDTARQVKDKIYGSRMVLFAPIYLTNVCSNNCLYCSFRKDNTRLESKILSHDEIDEEAVTLIKQGHKRLLLVCGELPKKADVHYVGEAIQRIYKLSSNGNNIRCININAAPLDVTNFKLLKSYGIGTYQYFQETYHYSTYRLMHPNSTKNNYEWRLFTMDRALQAGIDDVGLGVLIGLTDYKFETLALLSHAFDLDFKYGIGPHTISVPRLEPVINVPAAMDPPHAVDDLSFKKIIAVIRLSLPYTGITLSTRERAELRKELISVGVSQISTGSRISAGKKEEINDSDLSHFQLGDQRDLEEMVKECTSLGYIPSFCTACHRAHRTGDRFMELAKSGNISRFCVPNSLTTFREYLNDFASTGTKEEGNEFLEKEIGRTEGAAKKKVIDMIGMVDKGERDLYF